MAMVNKKNLARLDVILISQSRLMVITGFLTFLTALAFWYIARSNV
jgi:hypothetical protein